MIARDFTPFLLTIFHSLLLIHSSSIRRPPPFNLSHFIYPIVTAFTESNTPPRPPQFLQSVLDEICKKEKWALEDIWVSELDVERAKYRIVQRYDFRVGVGKTEVALKMLDKMSEWEKLVGISENQTSSFEALARRIGSTVVIDSLKVEGPLEMMVVGDDDQLSLMLPLNNRHFGLRRILVGEGITVEVKGAVEISIFQPSDYQFLYGFISYRRRWNDVKSVWPPLCPRSLLIHIRGSSLSVVAYRNKTPHTLIHTAFISEDSIELLPDKCYCYQKPSMQLPTSLRSRIAAMERVLNETVNLNSALKVRMGAFPMHRFVLEIGRNITSNENTLPEWKTRPSSERVWFEVVGRVESEIMKPVLIKKVVRPLMDSDSFSSNLSFAFLPPLLLPPEPLTLEVKW